MRSSTWRTEFAARLRDPGLRSWLTEPGSLTARCQRSCRQFAVRLLAYGRGPALGEPAAGRQRVREVLLECDGVPVIFAHTTLSTASRGRLTRWLGGLGSRSLGSLLFAHPGFRRGPIEYRRLDARDALYRRAAVYAPNAGPLWARRSRHWLDGQPVLVTEVFLPAIAGLSALPRPDRRPPAAHGTAGGTR